MWSNRHPVLTQLDFELTERCNNRCSHCCINLQQDDATARSRELSTAMCKKIIAEAADLGAITIRFTGGEPLLRPDFEELYVHSRRLGLRVLLFTNARLITPGLADLFYRIPPLQTIEISVYGMSEQSYEAVSREKGSFREFRRGIDLLLAHQIPFVVKSALLPANIAEVGAFEEWAKSIPGMRRPPSITVFLSLRHRQGPFEKENALIKKLRISPCDGVAFLKRRFAINEVRQFCNAFMGPQGDLLFPCGAGEKPCVDAYGNLQPCLPLRHPETTYALAEGSLREAMEKFFPKLREMRATNEAYLARCARCFLKGLCEQCPAKSFAEHGTLDTPVDYYCQIAHVQARDLGLIAANEKGWEVEDWKDRIARL